MDTLEKQFRQKKMGILKFCAECLCYEPGFLLFATICEVPRPAQEWFEEAMRSLKSMQGSSTMVMRLVLQPHAMLEQQLHSVLDRSFWNEVFVKKGGCRQECRPH